MDQLYIATKITPVGLCIRGCLKAFNLNFEEIRMLSLEILWPSVNI